MGQWSGPLHCTIVAAVEDYDAALDHYFVTSLPEEIAALDGGQFPGWVRTGLSFNVYAAASAVAGSAPPLRLFGRPAAGPASPFFPAPPPRMHPGPQRFPGIWPCE